MAEDKIDALNITDIDRDSEKESPCPFDKKDMKGVLSKWTNYLLGWQDRYIVLKDGTLSYYRSQYDSSYGCRGKIGLAKASVTPHQFDEYRFDVVVNDSVWYLRAGSKTERQMWIDAIDCHQQTESGYNSESNLHRHESQLSLTSGTSIASTSSFKQGRGLREKLMEIETFRDILYRQIETLQGYFDSCAAATAHGELNDLTEDGIGEPDQLGSTAPHHNGAHFPGHSAKDLASILRQHGSHSVDFRGESFTFKATTSGMIVAMSNCIDLMLQREDAWKEKFEKEVDHRKKYEEAYKSLQEQLKKPQQNALRLTGPDCEEGPHSLITEDEFVDALDASLDKLEKDEEKIMTTGKHYSFQKRLVKTKVQPVPKLHLLPESKYYDEINSIVNTHIRQLSQKTADGKDLWQCIVEDGDLKVYKRELDIDGVALDPLKPAHLDSIPEILSRSDTVLLRSTSTYQGITGHEVCHYFWDIKYRMDWETTLDSSDVVEWLSEDTFVCHSVVKRVWPTSQRDALFWTHIRHVQGETDKEPDLWIVANYSTNHDSIESNKYVRVTLNIAMICQTILAPSVDGKITRDNIKCQVSYIAAVNPGGWAPTSILQMVYKREYPKFLKHFTTYVREATKDKEIML